ncbi:MAG: hypothetical protein EBZ69_01125 [Alphaproteobacteria bacterium]|nr:hypothetical protein [Alphaproteobacteria bacterium]NDG04625.1 hypothetical protein [Alphaproteobacteria bacterium]
MADVTNPGRQGGLLADVIMGGAAAGAGGMGLWHVLKSLKEKREREKAENANLNAIAAAPPSFVLPAPKQAHDLSSPLIPTAGGAGLGALIGAIRARKGKRLSGALGGALGGGALGLAGHTLTSRTGREALGRLMGATEDGNPAFQGWGFGTIPRAAHTLALPVAGGFAAAGGAGVVNSFLKDENTEENKNKVQQSRDEYFKTLLGKEEKTAFSSALDSAYVQYEKHAENNTLNSVLGWLGNRFHNFSDSTQAVGAFVPTIVGASALAGGAVGAHHMYNKTRANSQAKLYAAAAKARERMRGLDTPWVDPVELAQIKQITASNGLPNAIGG